MKTSQFPAGLESPFSEGTPPPPFLGTSLSLKQILKIIPLFLTAIQIGACKLCEKL